MSSHLLNEDGPYGLFPVTLDIYHLYMSISTQGGGRGAVLNQELYIYNHIELVISKGNKCRMGERIRGGGLH